MEDGDFIGLCHGFECRFQGFEVELRKMNKGFNKRRQREVGKADFGGGNLPADGGVRQGRRAIAGFWKIEREESLF